MHSHRLTVALLLAAVCLGCNSGTHKDPSSTTAGPSTPAHSLSGPATAVLDDVQIHINIGDSLAVGFSAPQNFAYSDLIRMNDDAVYANYSGEDLATLFPGTQLVEEATAGATSTDVALAVNNAIPAWPDTTAGGDVLVTISMGGNDGMNDLVALSDPVQAQQTADRVGQNYQQVIDLLKAKYEDIPNGRRVAVVGLNVYDPSDGTGSFPPTATQGLCGVAAALPPAQVQQALANLSMINDAIRGVLQQNEGYLADGHAHFSGHGVGSADDWFAPDCIHANTIGHHQLRRVIWQTVTGVLN